MRQLIPWIVVMSILACTPDGRPRARSPHERDECDEACGSGRTCNAGYALSPCMSIAKRGQRCGDTKDCEGDLECFENMCAPPGTADATARRICDWHPRSSCGSPSSDAGLRARLGPSFERIRFEPAAGIEALRSIRRGVLVRYASVEERNDRMVVELVQRVPPSFEIVVAEWGCVSREIMVLPEINCAPYGESEVAFVRDGKIVATGDLFAPQRWMVGIERTSN